MINSDTKFGKDHNMIDETKREVQEVIKEIENEFGASSIMYRDDEISTVQRMALWAFSNILIITTLRDG